MKENKNPIVFGASGFVASAILHSPQFEKATTPKHDEVDVTNYDAIVRFLDTRPEGVVVNCVAVTNMQLAEQERNDRAGQIWRVNVVGAENIAKACAETGKFLIHLSTDAVFSGTDENRGPYDEFSVPPMDLKDLSWYAYTKLEAERISKEKRANLAIVRISYPFGNPKPLNPEKDYVRKAIDRLQKHIAAVVDQYFTPTYIPDLEQTMVKLCQLKTPGLFHVSSLGKDGSPPTQYEFEARIAALLGETTQLNKTNIADLVERTGMPRSKYGGLLHTHTEKVLGVRFHTWEEALEEFIPQVIAHR